MTNVDYTHFIGEVIDVHICGRTWDGVVQDVRKVRDSLGWRQEVIVARYGSTFRVSPTALV